ncbi:hypothetical protein COO60DRAFT_734763 [Scenedesmus sp. NREL 46B-D3]|nr:hypothetical protein COO60DRAFT_734763 [Scenedesmus sp. NREL 46B-D3]
MSTSSGPPTQLVLAVHTVEAATAKVPFALILLLDFAKRKATPPGCKCRMVVPSDGITSVSMWDTVDPAGLQEWLTENLGSDCRTELHEVQEDFTWGLSLELARMRATEKVTDGSMKTIGALGERTSRAAEVVAAGLTTAVGSTQQKLEAWDQRTGVLTSAKETTAALQQRVIGAMAKAAENERMHHVVTNMSTGVSSSWAKVSSWVGQRLGDINVHEGADEPTLQAATLQHPRSSSSRSTAAHSTHGAAVQVQAWNVPPRPTGRSHSLTACWQTRWARQTAAQQQQQLLAPRQRRLLQARQQQCSARLLLRMPSCCRRHKTCI